MKLTVSLVVDVSWFYSNILLLTLNLQVKEARVGEGD